MTKNSRTVGAPYQWGPDVAAFPSLRHCILADDDGHFFGAENF